MSTSLAATPRSDAFGKGAARKLRGTGLVPAVVYGNGEAAAHIQVDPTEFSRLFRLSQDRNTVVEVEVDGQKIPTLVRDVQRNPLTRDILHIDFIKVEAGKPVTVMVPVTTTGKAVGEVIGGKIRVIRRELAVTCEYTNIPKRLVVDVTPMNLGDFVKASQVVTPEGVSVVYNRDFNVVSCWGRRIVVKPTVAPTKGKGKGKK